MEEVELVEGGAGGRGGDRVISRSSSSKLKTLLPGGMVDELFDCRGCNGTGVKRAVQIWKRNIRRYSLPFLLW